MVNNQLSVSTGGLISTRKPRQAGKTNGYLFCLTRELPGVVPVFGEDFICRQAAAVKETPAGWPGLGGRGGAARAVRPRDCMGVAIFFKGEWGAGGGGGRPGWKSSFICSAH